MSPFILAGLIVEGWLVPFLSFGFVCSLLRLYGFFLHVRRFNGGCGNQKSRYEDGCWKIIGCRLGEIFSRSGGFHTSRNGVIDIGGSLVSGSSSPELEALSSFSSLSLVFCTVGVQDGQEGGFCMSASSLFVGFVTRPA